MTKKERKEPGIKQVWDRAPLFLAQGRGGADTGESDFEVGLGYIVRP